VLADFVMVFTAVSGAAPHITHDRLDERALGELHELACHDQAETGKRARQHSVTYSFWVFLERVTAIVAAVSASVVAAKLFSEAAKGTSAWEWAAVLAIVAAIASATSGVLVGLGLSHKHDAARKAFSELSRQYSDFAGWVRRHPESSEIEARWDELRKRHAAVDDSAAGIGITARLAVRNVEVHERKRATT